MQVVAGPSGSGKSSLFPVAAAGVDHFNVDDRCAQLNRGSYLGIRPEIRAQANAECEAFIAQHIASRASFAVETTLRTDITFRQGKAARANGFLSPLANEVSGRQRPVASPGRPTGASGSQRVACSSDRICIGQTMW